MIQPRVRFPIGISDFRKLREDGFYYVDKTALIDDVIDESAQVLLAPRPRRFGKTLNLSMLRYFFEKSAEDRRPLFADPIRNLILSELELLAETRVSLGGFERVQIFALQIFHERELEQLPIGRVLPNHDRHSLEAGQFRSAPAALPCDDLEAFASGDHDDGLNDPLFPDRLSQVGEGPLREVASGLEPRGSQLPDLGFPLCSTWNVILAGQQGRKAAPEGRLLPDRHRPSRRFSNSRPRDR